MRRRTRRRKQLAIPAMRFVEPRLEPRTPPDHAQRGCRLGCRLRAPAHREPRLTTAIATSIRPLELRVLAELLAREITGRTGLVAESWMATNAQLLTGLRSQNASSIMIQTFVVLAVALGIASV